MLYHITALNFLHKQAALVVNPSLGFAFDFHHDPFFTILSRFCATTLWGEGTRLKYSLWVALFYSLVATLCASLLLYGYLARSVRQSLYPEGPARVLGLCIDALHSTLYCGALNMALLPLSCNYAAAASSGATLRGYPQQLCFAMPNAVHAAVGICAGLALSAAAWFAAQLQHCCPSRPARPDFCASSHADVVTFYIVTAAVLVEVLLPQPRALRAALLAALYLGQLWTSLRRLPHSARWANCGRAALHGMLAWGAVVLTALELSAASKATSLSALMLYGLAPAAAVSAAAAAALLRWHEARSRLFLEAASSAAMRASPPALQWAAAADSVRVRFRRPEDVELAARAPLRALRAVGRSGTGSDVLALQAAAILEAGLRQHSRCALLHVLLASHASDAFDDSGTAQVGEVAQPDGRACPCPRVWLLNPRLRPLQAHLSRAKGLDTTGISDRYCIFVVERERVRGGQAQGELDLASARASDLDLHP